MTATRGNGSNGSTGYPGDTEMRMRIHERM
jgi:hypothetical protein